MPFLGSVYQVFGLYSEIYRAMICMEEKESQSIHECISGDERETGEE
ncbi:phosphonate ABC transporter permease [Bacillus sp. AFS018417]|nr:MULTISPECIES: phosphonate ABC transporter permease [unclassified Bacillus (in: firmicutes)]MCP1124387.1 phosphonate ABC transporter permease [Bacillus sp. 3103sda1]PEZ04928.1 phosphonate ABC transporter permease [Bacillus sp. AFS018417]